MSPLAPGRTSVSRRDASGWNAVAEGLRQRGNPNVKALVYVAASMPDTGESPAELSTRFPGSELGTAVRPVPYADNAGDGTDLSIQNDRFHDVFAADPPERQTRLMAVEQRPVSAAGFAEKATAAAWKTIPSWFLVDDAAETTR
ncbi:hypothetical protein ACFV2S_20110 [Streptomyces sp. NPDC059695]|uniref:hypothetical protein n=1 Tax=Streptomyces sp. NPDC059695 TaxID=3346910 RepID=UPI003695A1DA